MTRADHKGWYPAAATFDSIVDFLAWFFDVPMVAITPQTTFAELDACNPHLRPHETWHIAGCVEEAFDIPPPSMGGIKTARELFELVASAQMREAA